eukprot:TRINITY_DN18747_c0_g1_i3.p1 TRINITY_DN18747_c0_g1~~TRINITY_DN18747_c0_g1_i3.p1  ORF type:complete len:1242 (-),score=192.43 TRINITY_DN18747_c0_g1_i3:65-3733(-)
MARCLADLILLAVLRVCAGTVRPASFDQQDEVVAIDERPLRDWLRGLTIGLPSFEVPDGLLRDLVEVNVLRGTCKDVLVQQISVPSASSTKTAGSNALKFQLALSGVSLSCDVDLKVTDIRIFSQDGHASFVLNKMNFEIGVTLAAGPEARGLPSDVAFTGCDVSLDIGEFHTNFLGGWFDSLLRGVINEFPTLLCDIALPQVAAESKAMLQKAATQLQPYLDPADPSTGPAAHGATDLSDLFWNGPLGRGLRSLFQGGLHADDPKRFNPILQNFLAYLDVLTKDKPLSFVGGETSINLNGLVPSTKGTISLGVGVKRLDVDDLGDVHGLSAKVDRVTVDGAAAFSPKGVAEAVVDVGFPKGDAVVMSGSRSLTLKSASRLAPLRVRAGGRAGVVGSVQAFVAVDPSEIQAINIDQMQRPGCLLRALQEPGPQLLDVQALLMPLEMSVALPDSGDDSLEVDLLNAAAKIGPHLNNTFGVVASQLLRGFGGSVVRDEVNKMLQSFHASPGSCPGTNFTSGHVPSLDYPARVFTALSFLAAFILAGIIVVPLVSVGSGSNVDSPPAEAASDGSSGMEQGVDANDGDDHGGGVGEVAVAVSDRGDTNGDTDVHTGGDTTRADTGDNIDQSDGTSASYGSWHTADQGQRRRKSLGARVIRAVFGSRRLSRVESIRSLAAESTTVDSVEGPPTFSRAVAAVAADEGHRERSGSHTQQLLQTSFSCARMSLAEHPAIPKRMTSLLTLLIMGNLGLFLIGCTTVGIKLMVTATAGGHEWRSPSIANLSIDNTIYQMWLSHAYPMFFVVVPLSVVWPFLKLVLLLVAWWRPLTSAQRGPALIFLDQVGKWSLTDNLVLMLLVAFFTVSYEGADLTGEPGDVGLHLRSIPDLEVQAFMLATVISLIVGHLALAGHRYASGHFSLASCVNSDAVALWRTVFPSMKEERRQALAVAGVVAQVLSLILIAVAWFAPLCRFQMGGVVGAFLLVTNQPEGVDYSLTTIISSLGEKGQHNIALLIIVYVMVVPLLESILLLVLWFVPLKPRWHVILLTASDVLVAWSSLDVFCLALFGAVIGGDAYGIGQFIELVIYSGNVAPLCNALRDSADVPCVTVHLSFLPSVAWFLVAVVFTTISAQFMSRAASKSNAYVRRIPTDTTDNETVPNPNEANSEPWADRKTAEISRSMASTSASTTAVRSLVTALLDSSPTSPVSRASSCTEPGEETEGPPAVA